MPLTTKLTLRQHGVEIEVVGDDVAEATAAFDVLCEAYEGHKGYASKKAVDDEDKKRRQDLAKTIATREAIKKKMMAKRKNGS
jgi:hypothetical protein